MGAEGAADLEGWENVEVGCGGASILIAFDTGGSFGLGGCVNAMKLFEALRCTYTMGLGAVCGFSIIISTS